MRKRTWTEQAFRDAVARAESFRQVLGFLGLRQAGGNYALMKKHIAHWQLSTTHFKGQGWSRGKSVIRKTTASLNDILVEGSSYQSHKLKIRLFDEGLKLRQCEECGWAQRSIDGRLPLELDHINGISSDNRLENLRILCPNCHSLTPTYRGKNIRRK